MYRDLKYVAYFRFNSKTTEVVEWLLGSEEKMCEKVGELILELRSTAIKRRKEWRSEYKKLQIIKSVWKKQV